MNYNESDIEDWLERELAACVHPNCRVLGRQITLPSGGRMDLLLAHNSGGHIYVTVVEVKKGRAGHRAVMQLLRYMDELETMGFSNVDVLGLVVAEAFSEGAERLVSRLPSVSTTVVNVDIQCYLDGAPGEYYFPSETRTPPDVLIADAFASRTPHHIDPGVRNIMEPMLRDHLVRAVVPRRRALACVYAREEAQREDETKGSA